MKTSYYDAEYINKTNVGDSVASLNEYRNQVAEVIKNADFRKYPSSLATYKDTEMIESVLRVTEPLMGARFVIVVGIGGSDLGTRAIHHVLSAGDTKQRSRLYGLDTSSETQMAELLLILEAADSVNDIAIFSISKSGGTAETLTNTAVLLGHLEERFGEAIYSRTVFIGNEGNPLLVSGAEKGGQMLTMPEIVGGRYSVFTAVGVAPLVVLGYDIDRIFKGVEAVMDNAHESAVAESAALLYEYLQHDVRNVKYFAFDARMSQLGRWWMQLTAESLGKTEDCDGEEVTVGFIPSAAFSVNLHSTEQLYFSGFKGVYTSFVSLQQPSRQHFMVPEDTPFAPQYGGKTIGEVNTAIQKGVLAAYRDRHLPHRLVQLGKDIEYEVGLYMASRMLETMYIAHLMNVNAFNQPNVELYKEKTRGILGV